jgi:hypothetical protein
MRPKSDLTRRRTAVFRTVSGAETAAAGRVSAAKVTESWWVQPTRLAFVAAYTKRLPDLLAANVGSSRINTVLD